MPLIIQTTTAKVSAIQGRAFIRDSLGNLRALKVGDVVVKGDQLLTEQDTIVQLTQDVDGAANASPPAAAEPVPAPLPRPTPALVPRPRPPIEPPSEPPAAAAQEVNRAITGIERADPQDAPGAGLSTAEGGFLPGLRVDRVVEPVVPAAVHSTPISGLSLAALLLDDTQRRAADAPAPPPELPALSVGDARVNENAGTLSFSVQLNAPSALPVSVNYSLTSGTATLGADFTAASGTLQFAPGVTVLGVSVPLQDDTVFEGDEAFFINLQGAVNARIADAQGQATLIDNDAAPVVSAVVAGAEVTEGAPLLFNVTLSNASAAATTLAFSLAGGSAGAGDIGLPGFSHGVTLNADGSLSVPAGVAAFSITVPTLRDALVEPDETLRLTVGGVSANGLIHDTPLPALPAMAINDVSVNEAAGTMSFTLSLSATSSTRVSVSFRTADGTATAGADYTTALGSLSFAPGVQSITLTVPIVDDAVFEGTERFTVILSEPVGATLARATGVGEIVDNDNPPVVLTVEPGAPGAQGDAVLEGLPLAYTVTLSGLAAAPQTYPFSLGGGSASAGDFGAPVFSNGVVLNANGTITVPPGVASFTVSVPTTPDSIHEATETVPLRVGGVSATGSIIDDDAPPSVIAVTPNAPSVNEGVELVFTVSLSGASELPLTLPFALGGGSASGADIGFPRFSNGVHFNPDGTLNVPAGVTSFTVTLPTLVDGLDEPDETVLLRVGGVGGVIGSGVIIDVDPPPSVSQISLAAANVPEGGVMVFSVTLGGPTAAATTYPFSLGGGTAGAADFGAPIFSHGVVLNADGTITVPAGLAGFSVSVPTLQDAIVESNENLLLTLGGVTASGTIIDDDLAPPPTITGIEPGAPGAAGDTVPEGTPAVFTVSLSAASDLPQTYPFSLGGGTASAGDFGAPTFSAGVVLNADGTITVPPGVASFSVSVPTTQDNIDEPLETLPLNIGGITAVASIVDDDAPPSVVSIDLAGAGARVPEGAELSWAVTLSNPSAQAVTLAYQLGGGSASVADHGAPQFSNGVVLNADGTLTVPPGVTGFTITVPTTQDSLVEGDETLPLSVGGVSATGTIIDDDLAPPPTITGIEPGAPGAAGDTVPEGTPAVFTVSLSGVSTLPQTYPFSLGGGTAGAGDFGAPTFSAGVVLNADGTITVPPGVANFSVSVPTTQDSTHEANETLPLSSGGVTATATIVDDDPVPTVLALVARDGSVAEGGELVFNVTLSGDSDQATRLAFSLGGGTASAADFGAPLFSNGVVLNADGTITVPAGVSSFSVSVPTLQDNLDESDESLQLSIGGVSARGIILDDDAPPTVTRVEPGAPGVGDDVVPEGGVAVFVVTLSGPSVAPVTLPFSLGGGSASAGDFGAPVFNNGVVLNADGTITVPAGVSGFTVSVPTVQDSTHELNETLALNVGGVSATATIIDDDPVPSVGSVLATGGSTAEGGELVYSVTLNGSSDQATSLTFEFAGGTAGAADIGAPRFSNGVSLNPDGTLNVPPGVAGFSVTVPALQDGIDEGEETLVVNVGGVSATGVITAGFAPPIISIEPGPPGSVGDQVREGDTGTFTVTLAGSPNAPSYYAFSLGGGSAGVGDYGAPVFSHGVVLNADGTITVPAGVSAFTVSIATVQDSLVEGDETVPLRIGTATATLTIVDDDFINSAPVAGADSASTPEDAAVLGNVLGNDSAAPGNALSVAALAFGGNAGTPGAPLAGAWGTLVLNPNGSYHYTPGAQAQALDDGRSAVDVFTYTVSDGAGGLASTTLSVTVTGSNDAPVCVADAGSTPEDTPVSGNVLANDSDADGEPIQVLSYSVAGLAGSFAPGALAVMPNVGALVINADGSFSFNPVPNYHGPVPAATYLAGDGSTSTPGTLSLTVTPRNDAPQALADAANTDEDTPVSGNVLANDSDVDGPGLAVAGVSFGGSSVAPGAVLAGQYGSLVLQADGHYTYTPGAAAQALVQGQSVLEQFSYSVSDGAGGSAQATLTLTVAGRNDAPPLLSPGNVVVSEEGLPAGNPDAGGNPDTSNVQQASGQISLGPDSAASSFSLSAPSAPLTSNGIAITWAGAGSAVLVGQAGGVEVVRVTISATGAYSVTLLQSVDQAQADAEDQVHIAIGVTATAADGSQANTTLNVTVEDDRPLFVAPASDLVVAGVTGVTMASGSLGLSLGADAGSQAHINLQGLSVDGNGHILASHVGAGGALVSTVLTYQGMALHYESGSTPGNLLAVASNGTVVFTLTAAAHSGQMQVTLLAAPDAAWVTDSATGLRIQAAQSIRLGAVAVDADGDSTATTNAFNITFAGGNAAPVIAATQASVSEEGLGGGLPDAHGSPHDTTNARQASGGVLISDPEGQPISNVVLQAPTQALSSGGASVVWAGSGTPELVASANGQVVATVRIDDAGHYTFTLHRALDHPAGAGENLLQLNIGVRASDGQRTGSGLLTINVEDDAPSAAPVQGQVRAVDSNVMIVLDVSGSMANASGISGLSRLQAAVKAVGELLDRYDDAGNVAVRLVTFGTHARALGECWTTVAQAKALLANVQATGGTNYDEALADAMAAFGASGKISGAQNVSYFLSDGKPTYGSGTVNELSGGGSSPATNGTGRDSTGADTGIQVVEEGLWTQFLNANQINSFALGMGADLPNALALDPVAYDGRAHTNTAGQLVSDLHALGSVLLATTASHAGQLLAGVGADGGVLQSFSAGGVSFSYTSGSAGVPGAVCASGPAEYRFDVATQTLHVQTAAGGEFHVDMVGGGYSYSAPAAAHASFSESFAFSVVDRDGDVASASGSLNVAATASSGHTAGADLIVGTAGADHLLGGGGADVFKWSLGDPGLPGAPVEDRIGDFNPASRSAGGDVLDLRDLLQGESLSCGTGNLTNFLDFDTASLPGSTVLRISSSGGFTQGSYNACAEDQRIVLEGVDLRSSLGLGGQASDTQIIQELLNRNKLEAGP